MSDAAVTEMAMSNLWVAVFFIDLWFSIGGLDCVGANPIVNSRCNLMQIKSGQRGIESKFFSIFAPHPHREMGERALLRAGNTISRF
jgi:hypothetical protein